jgi:hypothetical protein
MASADKAAGPSREEEVEITYVKSRDGKKRTIPVWFTLNEGKMELVPMYGVKTKWFNDVEKSGFIELRVKDWKKGATPKIVREPATLMQIRRRFMEKYGADEVNRYYRVPTDEQVALEILLV